MREGKDILQSPSSIIGGDAQVKLRPEKSWTKAGQKGDKNWSKAGQKLPKSRTVISRKVGYVNLLRKLAPGEINNWSKGCRVVTNFLKGEDFYTGRMYVVEDCVLFCALRSKDPLLEVIVSVVGRRSQRLRCALRSKAHLTVNVRPLSCMKTRRPI